MQHIECLHIRPIEQNPAAIIRLPFVMWSACTIQSGWLVSCSGLEKSLSVYCIYVYINESNKHNDEKLATGLHWWGVPMERSKIVAASQQACLYAWARGHVSSHDFRTLRGFFRYAAILLSWSARVHGLKVQDCPVERQFVWKLRGTLDAFELRCSIFRPSYWSILVKLSELNSHFEGQLSVTACQRYNLNSPYSTMRSATAKRSAPEVGGKHAALRWSVHRAPDEASARIVRLSLQKDVFYVHILSLLLSFIVSGFYSRPPPKKKEQ